MQKKIFYIVMLCFMLFQLPTYASSLINTDEIIKTQLEIFDWHEIEQLEESLKASLPYMKDFDVQDEVVAILMGQKEFSVQNIVSVVGEMIFGEIYTYINVIIRFILIILLCNILNNLSSAFESKNTTKVAFFVCHIVILYSVAQSLVLIVQLAQNTIENLLEVMLVILPTLLTFMATSGYIATSATLAPVIIGGLTLITFIIQRMMLPSIVGIIVLQMISSMSQEFKIDKLIALFYKISRWVLRSIFFLSLGIMSIYRMSLPYVDVTMRRVGLTLTAKFIPILGDAVSGAIDLIIQYSGMIKSAFGIGIILWIIFLISMPLIRILTYILLFHFAGAVIEPLGDKKMAKMATDIAKGCEFIMSCVGTVAILSIMALVVCMSIGASLL